MKIKQLLILVFASPILCSAQSAEPVIMSVTYHFKHVNDLNRTNIPNEEETILRLGKNQSRYNSWTDELSMKTPIKVNGSSSKPKTGGSYNFVPMVAVDSKGIKDFDLIQDRTSDKIIRLVTLGSSNFLIESKLPAIDWKIVQEKRKIGGYSCQKAIGSYGGRTYTAWFSSDLPFQNGPWKLSGLPGLILEAQDATGQVAFLFKELNKADGNETTALRKTRVIKVSEEAFNRASLAFEKNPVAAYQAQLPIGSQEAELGFKDSSGTLYLGEEGKKRYEAYKKSLKQRKSNPLELKNN